MSPCYYSFVIYSDQYRPAPGVGKSAQCLYGFFAKGSLELKVFGFTFLYEKLEEIHCGSWVLRIRGYLVLKRFSYHAIASS